eukprot:469317-Amphidinium_carterae.2
MILRSSTSCTRESLHGPSAADQVKAESEQRLVLVKERYPAVSLKLKAEKERLCETEATIWGAELSSKRKEVRCNLKKLRTLVFLTKRLLSTRRVSTRYVQKFVGCWVHFCMFQRVALSILQETYRWIEQGVSSPHVLRTWSYQVWQELQGFVLLFPMIRSDISSFLCPELFATDATQDVGAVIKADASLDDVLFAWT